MERWTRYLCGGLSLFGAIFTLIAAITMMKAASLPIMRSELGLQVVLSYHTYSQTYSLFAIACMTTALTVLALMRKETN